jgi:hypothetical protein
MCVYYRKCGGQLYGEVGIEADRVDVEEGYRCDAGVVGEFGEELG